MMTERTSILLSDLSSKHHGQLSIVFSLKIWLLILQKSIQSNDDVLDLSSAKGNSQERKISGTTELYTIVRESSIDQNDVLWSREILPTTGETPQECKARLIEMFDSLRGATAPIFERLRH